MKLFNSLLVCSFLNLMYLSAAEVRTWTSTAGTKLEAELVGVERGSAVLKKANGSTIKVKLKLLVDEDQKLVREFEKEQSKGETVIEELGANAGAYSGKIQCKSDDQWHYFLYLPKQFHTGKKWPVCFVMSPQGGGHPNTLNRYRAASDRFGVVMALSVESKNGFNESASAAEAMIDDVYDRVPVLEKMAFSTGFSGGARMAYLMAERDKRIAAVLACGAGGGVYLEDGSFRESRLRSNTYVYSLIGSNCFNRGGSMKSHKSFSKSSRLRYFPGNHNWAGESLIEQGMALAYGESLSRYKGSDKELLKLDYLATLETLVNQLAENEPWEAYWLTSFLKESKWLDGDIEDKHNELEKDERVQLAQEAEKDITVFARKHYNVFYKQDQKPNAARLKEAEKLAKKYEELPHGSLIQRLGQPAK